MPTTAAKPKPKGASHEVATTRAVLGHALRLLDEDGAAAAARALVQAKKADQRARAREMLAEAGITAVEVS
jgi:hypothetical protein